SRSFAALRMMKQSSGRRDCAQGEENEMGVATGLFLARDHTFRSPQQGALDVGVGEVTDSLARRVGILMGPDIGRFNRVITAQRLEDFAQRHSLERPLPEHSLDTRTLFG